MATIDLTPRNLDATIDNNDIVLIDFWAPWCAPCRMFGPIFEKVSDKHPDITFAKANTEAESGLGSSFGVQSIPTLAIFREKIMVFKQAGALPEKALEDILKQVKELDMDDVRKQIEKEEKEISSF